MNKLVLLFLFTTALVRVVDAQDENPFIRSGNKQFEENKFTDAEVDYRKAIDKNQQSFKATFNLADALFRQKKYDEAIKEFDILTKNEKDKARLANVFYNIGNCNVQKSDYDAAIVAYKSALKNNPQDSAAKYNLAYSLLMKKKQDQQNKQNQQNKDQQNKDQQDKDQQKQDQKQQQQNKDKQDQKNQQNKDQQKQDQQQDKQQQKGKLSKEDAARMLDAMQNDENKTQQKVKEAEKQEARSVKIEKDW